MREERIGLDDIQVGDDVHLHYADRPGAAQGGVITAITPDAFVLRCGTAGIVRIMPRDEIDHATVDVPHGADECLEYGPDCSGPVDYWHSGGINGRSWPRCIFHRDKRWEAHDNSMARYADSDVAPDWFDPSYAGERWEDDY